MIKTIVEIDRRARLRASETQTYREKALRQLDEQTQQLAELDKQRIEETVSKYNERLQKQLHEQLIDIENGEKLALKALDDAFNDTGEAWADELVRRVLAN